MAHKLSHIRIEMKKNIILNRKGMTVIEMLISIFVFCLIIAGSVFLLQQIYKRYGFSMEQGMSVTQVQHSLKIMIEEIRRAKEADSGAYPVQSADKFSFTFYTDVDNDSTTEKVHYFLDGTSIKKGVSEPSGTPPVYPSGDQSVTIIGNYVHNTASQPLFSYYDPNYPADQTNNPIATPVSQVDQIRMVKADIYFNLDPYRSPDNIRLESYVEMRNLKDNW